MRHSTRTMSTAVVLLMMMYVSCSADDTGSDKFVPTSEWSEINEGQSIGKGLHVRLNLETGKKEAKLLSPDENNDAGTNSVVVVNDEVVEATQPSEATTLRDVEEGLKHVASSRGTGETVSQKFRTLDELRSVMPNLELKTEGQLLSEAVVRLNETAYSDVTYILIALESIEDLAHKYDNGLLMATEGWMGVVGSLLHHSDENVYRAALRVISSAAQSNPSVQKHCIESGYLSLLLSRILLQNDKLAKSTVFCVGAMARNLPAALQTFSDMSSYQILTDKLVTSTLPSLQRVILSLFNDLLHLDTQLGSNVVEKIVRSLTKDRSHRYFVIIVTG